ncbi:MAG: phosphoribosylanthranilate isomerase [Ruminococcus sp.]|nr:phosphoribosylanthranilate isomerase [Ruminococcus sp.]
MTKIKMCGLSRTEDIKFANHIMPEFVGFVFYEKSSRYVDPVTAAELRWELDYRIAAVGVFVDAPVSFVADLARREVIDAVQLHGSENNEYIAKLRSMVDVPIIQAFRVSSPYDIESAVISDADFVLLDSGTGSGNTFDHSLIKGLNRPYFLAGGITPENVREAAEKLHPYAVDASSSLEIDGVKSFERMKAFAEAVRN